MEHSRKYKSIQQVREFIISKTERLENFITWNQNLPRIPIPSDFSDFYTKILVPEFNKEVALGIKDLSVVLDDLSMTAETNEMKIACSLLSSCVRSMYKRPVSTTVSQQRPKDVRYSKPRNIYPSENRSVNNQRPTNNVPRNNPQKFRNHLSGGSDYPQRPPIKFNPPKKILQRKKEEITSENINSFPNGENINSFPSGENITTIDESSTQMNDFYSSEEEFLEEPQLSSFPEPIEHWGDEN